MSETVPSATAPTTTVASTTATPSASSAAVIPTECTDLIASTAFTASFGAWPLNDPAVVGTPGSEYYIPAGTVMPTPAASGATPAQQLSAATQLRCVWRDPAADITGLTVEIATVDPALANGYLASLPAEGYTCAPTITGAGLACENTRTDPTYGVDIVATSFLRGDTYIQVNQANVSTPDLIAALEAKLWA